MAELKKHISIQRIGLQQKRYKKPGFGRPPDRDNVLHGIEINRSLQDVLRQSKQNESKFPPIMNPVHVIRLKYDTKITEDVLRRANLDLLDEEPDHKIVVLSEDGLKTFERQIAQYGQQTSNNQNPSYKALIAALNKDMENSKPEHRIGSKLKEIVVDLEKEYRLDVEIWAGDDSQRNKDCTEKFRLYVLQSNGRILDSHITNDLILFRVALKGQYIERLLNDANIRTVDLPPVPDNTVTQSIRKGLDSFPRPESPPESAQGICIIDSGILVQHPLLETAIGYTHPFHTNLRDGYDENGHGTFVTGIALYGDVLECINSLNFEPNLYVYGARVLNKDNRFDDERLVVKQIEEAIRYFHSNFNCRVFNISICDPDLVYSGKKPSVWAHKLDTLVRELDIVIIVSAGNLPMSRIYNENADRLFKSYPHYLLNGFEKENDTRILEPATAANVITVGALANSVQSYQEFRYQNDLIKPVANQDMPSPFTRRGPGVNNSIKPDVCEYGGNILWRHSPNDIVITDQQMGVVSTIWDFISRNHLFGADAGTSFAAPKVAHLAGLILNQYPSASANLVRALIANSSNIPNVFRQEIKEKNLTNDDLLKLYGYGKPEKQRALYSDETRVTLFAEEVIELDTIHIYEIPIPKDFQELKGERRISVSLAYDPPTRRTRYDYLGIGMDFYLFRGLGIQQLSENFAEREDEVDPTKILKKYYCNMTPSPIRRKGGTLQKGIWTATKNQSFTNYDNGGLFHLLVRCQSRPWASQFEYPKQRYAIAVTLEYDDGMIDLYNLVQQQVKVEVKERIRL